MLAHPLGEQILNEGDCEAQVLGALSEQDGAWTGAASCTRFDRGEVQQEGWVALTKLGRCRAGSACERTSVRRLPDHVRSSEMMRPWTKTASNCEGTHMASHRDGYR